MNEAALFSNIHPVTAEMVRQVIELDWLVRRELGRHIQITVRCQDGQPVKQAWYSVR